MAAHCEGAGGIGWMFGHLIDGVQAQFARVPFAETSVHTVPHFALDEIEHAYDVFGAADEHDALKVVLTG